MVTARAAGAWPAGSAETLVLGLFGSPKSLLARASLTRMVPSGVVGLTRTTTSIVALPPGARLPSLQVKGCEASPSSPRSQEPWLGVKLTTPTWAERTSWTTTLGAVDGPAL